MSMRKISTIAELFGTILSTFLSGKVTTINKMSLTDKEEINANDYNTAKVLNTFFSTISLISQNIRTVNLLLTISGIMF